jgi:hypothetical protein
VTLKPIGDGAFCEEYAMEDVNRLFILKAMYEKCRHDKRLKGFCRYGHWKSFEGRNSIIPDDYFADWVRRLTRAVFSEYVDTLYDQGLVEFFDASNREVFFEITEKGKAYVLQDGVVAK